MSQISEGACSFDSETWSIIETMEADYIRNKQATPISPGRSVAAAARDAPAQSLAAAAVEPGPNREGQSQPFNNFAKYPRRSVRSCAIVADTKRNLRGVVSPEELSTACLQQVPAPAPGVATAGGALHGRGAHVGEVVLSIRHPAEEPAFILGRTFDDPESTFVFLDPMVCLNRRSSRSAIWAPSGEKSFSLPRNRVYVEKGTWFVDASDVTLFRSERSFAAILCEANEQRQEQSNESLSSQHSFDATQC